MSMVEVVVAALLLGIMATIGTAAIVQGQAATVANRSRVVAANLAARELDLARQRLAVSPAAVEALVAEGVVTNAHPLDETASPGDPDGYVVDGMTYTVERRAGLRVLGDTSACQGGSTYATKRATEVEVTVSWEDMRGARPQVLRQLFAPHQDLAPDTEDALVAVRVRDDGAQPVTGVTARATTTSGALVATGTTDASGCVVLAVQPSAAGGQLDVTLSSAGVRHVDRWGNAAPVRTLYGVEVKEITRAEFEYARAGTVIIRLSGGSASSQVTVVRPDGELVVRTPDAGSGGTRVTISDAYPGQWGVYPGTDAVPPGTTYPFVTLPAGGSVELALDLS